MRAAFSRAVRLLLICPAAALLLAAGWLLFLFVCSLFVARQKQYESDSRFYRRLLYVTTALLLKAMRIRVCVSGLELLPKDRRLLFVSNHRSNFDPIIQWQVLKAWNPAFISKESNFRIPIFGRIVHRCCFLPIDREDPRKAIRTINRAAALMKAGTVSIGIYPEGTRSRTGELLPFHDGLFRIAQKAGVPMAVVTIRGTERIRKNFPLRKTEVAVRIEKVISAEDMHADNTHRIGAGVREIMIGTLGTGKEATQ
jgi:1-acyl-sn-glycerol-3-phosphate acyltransferase